MVKTSDKKSKPKAQGNADAATEAEGDASEARFDPKPVNVGGESLVDRLYPHRKKIALFIGSALAIWGIVAIVVHVRAASAEKATGKLVSVLDVGREEIRQPGEAADPKKLPSFANAKERADAVLDALAKQGTDAAGPVYRASLLVTAGKLDDAINEYQLAAGQPGLDGVLAREGLGLAQEQRAIDQKDATAKQKGLEEALATFESMQPDETGPRHSYALYHQGRILALLGKTADAKAAFDKAKALAKDSPELGELVDEHLAGLGS